MLYSRRASLLTVLLVLVAASEISGQYFALPRQGRSHVDQDSTCCHLGLKEEWRMLGNNNVQIYRMCQAELPCCYGLQEVSRKKPNGMMYTVCAPVQKLPVDTDESFMP